MKKQPISDTTSDTSSSNASNPPAFVLPVRIYYEDTDAGGVVYYANYLRYCERGRSEWLRELGFSQKELLDSGGPLFVISKVQADYLASGHLDDSLKVITTLHDLHGASVWFKQRIMRDNVILFEAKTKVACVNPLTGRPTPWPEAVFKQFQNQLSLSQLSLSIS
ncbi:MAG: tol-pal system-associated acyl-CoA thioesterase [Azoarcus sp.]|nr:tol-pal system-associated acyl-CoA thioesterase [Azoarcus sp.]